MCVCVCVVDTTSVCVCVEGHTSVCVCVEEDTCVCALTFKQRGKKKSRTFVHVPVGLLRSTSDN